MLHFLVVMFFNSSRKSDDFPISIEEYKKAKIGA